MVYLHICTLTILPTDANVCPLCYTMKVDPVSGFWFSSSSLSSSSSPVPPCPTPLLYSSQSAPVVCCPPCLSQTMFSSAVLVLLLPLSLSASLFGLLVLFTFKYLLKCSPHAVIFPLLLKSKGFITLWPNGDGKIATLSIR